MAGGLAADTPVAAVTVGHPARAAHGAHHAGRARRRPTSSRRPTIVIGAVAGLDLRWFERRPLFGRRVVVTRARDQASSWSAGCGPSAPSASRCPTIAIVDPADGGAALRAAAGSGRSTTGWCFTSANAVDRSSPALRDARAFGAGAGRGHRSRHRRALAALAAWSPTSCPTRSVAEALVDAFPATAAGRVLLPQAAGRPAVLPDGLGPQGWEVDVVEAYRTVPGRPPPARRWRRPRRPTPSPSRRRRRSTTTSTRAGAGRGAAGRRVHRPGHRRDRP